MLLRRSTGSAGDVRACARLLLDAGADPASHTVEWDGEGRMSALFDAVERSDLELVRLLVERGATADLDPVDAAVLAVARGESVRLPKSAPPALGNPRGDDFGWILGQFAVLGRADVVRALLD
ncbi:MAG: ankyrin repeat domain-containing protein, partial [Solirubrobacteraceae bacterium]